MVSRINKRRPGKGLQLVAEGLELVAEDVVVVVLVVLVVSCILDKDFNNNNAPSYNLGCRRTLCPCKVTTSTDNNQAHTVKCSLVCSMVRTHNKLLNNFNPADPSCTTQHRLLRHRLMVLQPHLPFRKSHQ